MQPESAWRHHFGAYEEKRVVPEIGAEHHLLTAAQIEQYRPILEGFEENHERLLRRDDIETRMGQIENLFIASGRFLDVIAIYTTHVEEDGATSRAAARLVWAYLRLGQQAKARRLLDAMLAEDGQNAQVHLLEGRYWNRFASESDDKVIAAWQKALELSPNLQGVDGTTATMLRGEVARRAPAKAEEPTASPALPTRRSDDVGADQ